jgi:hypothetical protein
MQKEIKEPSDLLDEDGNLIQVGWAKKPILHYNRENINASWLRIKEWDYYAVLNDEFGISLTISDVGYLALIAIDWLDFTEKENYSGGKIKFFTKGKMDLPLTSEKGDVHFKSKNMELSFIKEESQRILRVESPKFKKNDKKGMKGEIILQQDPHMDSMVIVTPFKKKKHNFYYNQKINCMPAKGEISIGENTFDFGKKKSFGVLDWGRGVWPYNNTWYWGSASGEIDNIPFGFNIGYGFGDLSSASENMIFYDGKAHKLDRLTFHIDTKDYLKPWKFTSNDGRFELELKPILDRDAGVNLLILKMITHQVFGYYNGTVILDDGKKIEVNNLLGFAEEVKNRW